MTLADGTVTRMLDLRSGDLVQTIDEATHKPLNTTVTLIEAKVGYYFGISIETGKGSITTTEEHIFRVLRAGFYGLEAIWKSAKMISKGDLLVTGTMAEVTEVTAVTGQIIYKTIKLKTESCTVLSNGILTNTCMEGQNCIM